MKVKPYLGHDVPKGARYYTQAAKDQAVYFYDRNCMPIGSKSAFVIHHSELVELPEEEAKPDWDNAPEWADRVMSLGSFNYWCSVSNYAEFDWYKVSGEERRFEAGGVTIGDFELIEMRPEVKPEVWVPSSGKNCEAFHKNSWAKCFYVGVDVNGEHVYQVDSEFAMYGNRLNIFRPLKTQEEIEREAFEMEAFKLFETGMSCHTLVKLMSSARFTAPKGDNNE